MMACVIWGKTTLQMRSVRYILLSVTLGLYAGLCQGQQEQAAPEPQQPQEAPVPAADSTQPAAGSTSGASSGQPSSDADNGISAQSNSGHSEEAQAAPQSEDAPQPVATPPQQTPPEPLPTIPVASTEPPEKPTPEPASDGKQVLETVVVTASKRKESIRDIPISVDAFTEKDLESRGANNSQDALLFSPGVSVNAYYSPTLTQVEVRGTTTQTEATNQAAPVGAFLDDVTLGNPSLVGGNPNIDVFDL